MSEQKKCELRLSNRSVNLHQGASVAASVHCTILGILACLLQFKLVQIVDFILSLGRSRQDVKLSVAACVRFGVEPGPLNSGQRKTCQAEDMLGSHLCLAKYHRVVGSPYNARTRPCSVGINTGSTCNEISLGISSWMIFGLWLLMMQCNACA